nr:MAG TPA: hypothetical protein [Herelleviridae sp.]
MSVSVMSEWMATVPQDEVKERYGLEAHEWAGSLSDRVMAIINKNDPAREDQVNALLRDNAVLLEKRFQGYRRPGPDEDFIDYAEFRDAIACVVENGVSINDETYSQIHYVDSACVRSLSKALLRPYHEVYPNANVQVYYRRELREQGYQKPDESYIKSVYGLRGDEWTGTSADVEKIINDKISRMRPRIMEQRVNDFLRDQVAVFEIGMEKLEAENATYNDMGADACVYGYDLRDSIKEAVENGILINAETMNAIKRVEHNYVTPYAPELLTRQYDELRELNDARKYYRETVPTLVSSHAEKKPGLSRQAAQEIADFSVITGGSAHGKEQIQLANALEQWMRSTGRDTDGQPSASPTPSQGSRQGSIAAVLPGSSITVGRQTPRVRPTSASHKSAPQRSDSYEVDGGFEL